MYAFRGGYITLFSGCMFSGKTQALFAALWRLEIKYSVILFKPRMDTRYRRRKAASHNGSSFPSRNVVSTQEIDAWLEANEIDVIGIDEAQFLDVSKMSLVELAQKWANKGKIVIVAALDKDFQGLAFPGIKELWVVAEISEKFHAICKGDGCDSLAAYSDRTVSGTGQILVGGKDAYRPLCRSCFNKAIAERS